MKLADLAPRDAAVRELANAHAHAYERELHARERDCARGFTAHRFAEFAAGRWCARQALRELGAPDSPLLVGDSREPAWPDGFVGSITHAASYCAAVACRTTTALSLGIDAEHIAAIERDLWPSFMSDAELAHLQQHSPEQRASIACALWCAKEAYFKCQFPLTHRTPDYREVTLQLGDRNFAVTRGGTLTSHQLEGRYGLIGAGLTAAVAVARA